MSVGVPVQVKVTGKRELILTINWLFHQNALNVSEASLDR
jgi:hypothetical protein